MKTTHIHRSHFKKQYILNRQNALYHTSDKISQQNYDKVNIEDSIKYTAGQDTIISKKINQNEILIGCFDGHGTNGHYHSFITSGILSKMLLDCIPIFKLHLINNNYSNINNLITYCYNKTQEELYNGSFINIDKHSGSTAAVALILEVEINGKKCRKLISTNAGDSSIILKTYNGDTRECSLEHNCDNIEAVNAYLKRLKLRKKYLKKSLEIAQVSNKCTNNLIIEYNKCEPKPIYYFREESQIADWLKSIGIEKPLVLYNYINDEAQLNKTDYEIINTYYPHGQQSIRVPDTYKREDGKIVAIEGREHDNWGSSLKGSTQTLNGFGDIFNYPHISPEPYISINDIDDKCNILIASDGITDLFDFEALMKFINNNCNNEDFDNIMYNHIFEISSKYPQYGKSINTYTHKVHPLWDDISCIIITLDDISH